VSEIDRGAREAARRRALGTARAITLGLALTATGCEQLGDGYCRTFARGATGAGDGTSYWCARAGGTWDPVSARCDHPYAPFAMPGPFVPPAERA
jgi:hypothetical protein